MSYDRAFFAAQDDRTVASAEAIVPLVTDLLAPRAVVDVGCGTGHWLAAFARHGATDLLGLDGDYLPRDQLVIPPDRFRPTDLGQEIRLDRRFDLAVSLEVAEHLPAARADGFVADLVRLAPAVLFSAAVPFQGGTHHVNEQWPGYWADRFAAHGYRPVDAVRPQVWDDDRVLLHYRQNTLLYASADALAGNDRLRAEADRTAGRPLAVVHPGYYLRTADPANVGFRNAVAQVRVSFAGMVGRKLARLRGRR